MAEATVAGPGFINLRLTDAAWRDELTQIAAAGDDYGRSTSGKGVRVNVEYVSANPTGPMHMGHCRGAVVGDALASLLEFAGHDVIREYYVNDAGGQVDVLARSAHPATARRWAKTSARSPKASIRATIWSRSARRSPTNLATAMRRRRKANGSRCSAPARSRRCWS